MIGQWVRADFGVDLVAAEEVRLGSDHRARLWRGVTAGGDAYAVKLSGGGTAAGLVVAAHLAAHCVPGIAGPLAAGDGRAWSDRDGRRLSVVPWLAGARAVDGPMTAAHWRSLGRVLRAVHAAPPVPGLPREEHDHAAWWAVYERVAGRLPAPERMLGLLRGADALAARLRDRPRRDVVCHADPHVGNVLLDGDDGVWLLDFDDAMLAPAERDLMFFTGGVLGFAPVTAAAQEAFGDGYGPVAADPERIAYHQCVRALEDVLDFADRGEWSYLDGLHSPAGLVTVAEGSLRRAG
ncbi:phosphotransferase enzyme family protein [Spirilliplanes yamanashiensis]|uniref:Spectinomycin phosphotransferase n=1 Tax=Spirilliplanes yamanashiensis TaxID=42233 RepID=A0A8J3YCZ6_9ACTN|nr:phosphotransferase [Spirilliplanes yamanashiensis]MDP9819015.1 spectinomycin phosphotransferase [Spirilliplanes yamanashiensis]GIJ05470.1 spectinomycin phosphotransferase [Spirilliplanes yamanashiensis]